MFKMNQLKLNLHMVGATMLLFVVTLILNELLFRRLEFIPGVSWIYLPAGIRLLCTLLFAEAGAVGLLLVSWLVCFFYFFPNDPVRSFAGGILAAVAPYSVYCIARHTYGLKASLANLTPANLLQCALMFSLASPLLHHLWFAYYEHKPDLLHSFLVMVTGDFTGTLIVLYTARFFLRRARVDTSVRP
jgi:hypothetical protein